MLKIYKTIVKFLNKEASSKELENLETSLKDANNIPLFNQLVRIDYIISLCMKKYDLDKAKEAVNIKLKTKKREKRLNYFKYTSIAASIVLIISISIYINNNTRSGGATTDVLVNQTIESGSNKAVLTLESGKKIVLEKGKQYRGENLSSNGEEVVYSSQKDVDKKGKQRYNYLSVPRGGQFFLKLSDGTQVWVNSESRLKYPINFVSGETRKVELEYGEAYFEVSPSEKHNGASFNVSTGSQEIHVLGTKFNVRANRDDNAIVTTLAEGKVRVEKNNNRQLLKPDQQSIINDGSNQIIVEHVDASVITSWVRGLFIFEDESLHEMMDVLSRWYNVEVFFESEKFRNIPFTGVLERTKSLNQLLEIIEASSEGEVKFEIKDNVLLIK